MKPLSDSAFSKAVLGSIGQFQRDHQPSQATFNTVAEIGSDCDPEVWDERPIEEGQTFAEHYVAPMVQSLLTPAGIEEWLDQSFENDFEEEDRKEFWDIGQGCEYATIEEFKADIDWDLVAEYIQQCWLRCCNQSSVTEEKEEEEEEPVFSEGDFVFTEEQLEASPSYPFFAKMNWVITKAWAHTQYKSRPVPTANISLLRDNRIMVRWSQNSCSSKMWFIENDGYAYYETSEAEASEVKIQSDRYDLGNVEEGIDAGILAIYQALEIDSEKVAEDLINELVG